MTVLAVAALAAVTWRRKTQPMVRAALVIAAAAGLSYALSNNLASVGLLAVDIALTAGTWYLAKSDRITTSLGIAWIVVLIAFLLLAKLPNLQPLIGPGVWIGVSYLIFRLIHVSLDARRGRLSNETLSESITYVLHPASLVSGPIDRIQHHVSEQRCEPGRPSIYVSDGLWRLFVGLFKKAALANLLYAFIAQHNVVQNQNQPTWIVWLWLIAYGFYIYFDFAGYSDIALGVGRLMGLRLPENFANPYMQPTIAKFWQAWHITLSNWLRDYIFFPLSRNLMQRYGNRAATIILLVSHMTTMIACGLWHGIGSGFIGWGIWHGAGLFAYSQMPKLRQRFGFPVLPTALASVLTFIFVTLGWVFFSTDFPTALRIFDRLFGVS
jgi:alginate O-acetyltransferase complex protein AlgI